MSISNDEGRVASGLASPASDGVDCAIVLLSLDGHIVGWQGAAMPLFGYTEGEAVGMPHRRLLAQADVELCVDTRQREAAKRGLPCSSSHWQVRKDGTQFWGSCLMGPIRDQTGEITALAALVHDQTGAIEEFRGVEGRLRTSDTRSTRWRQNMDVFTHEVRNQLVPLTASLSLLGTTQDRVAIARAMTTMTRKLQVIGRLIADLHRVDVTRCDRPSIEFRPVEVRAAMAAAAEQVSSLVDMREQTLTVDMPEQGLMFEVDEQRLDQMLCNLLNNASKFTPVGGHITLGAAVENAMLVLRVEDDGCGISAHALPNVFELFTREDRMGAPAGFGVGLAVVKHVAELHGGTVEGRSDGPRRGSVFTVRLPLRR